MATKKTIVNVEKESIDIQNQNTQNLPPVEVKDVTTTKGKVSAKLNIVEQTSTEAQLQKVDKNQLFSVELVDYFCPVKFDSSALEQALSQLVASGLMSEDSKTAAIDKAKREFLEAHDSEIKASQNLTFEEVVAKLMENEALFKKVLIACNVSDLDKSRYIKEGKVQIFRANQCQDKDGNDRYQDATLSRTENGVVFSVPLFVEYREVTTGNVLLAIRYHQSYLDAAKRLLNKIADYKRILTQVFEAAKKAKDNGFNLEQVTEQVKKAFEETTETETK